MKSLSYSLYCTSLPRLTTIALWGLIPVFVTKAEEVERFTVTAERPYYDQTLDSIFPQYHYDKNNLAGTSHINDILLQSPSVNLNGQGGAIQNINIRGFSRWRIQSLLDGVPIVSDRRAGANVGFVPPSFIQSVSVIPGAASTYLGSGAIGGAVNLQLPYSIEPNLQIGWSSNQQAQDYSYADHAGHTDWSVSYRHGNNGSDAQGNTLFDKFEQTALFVRHRFDSTVIKEAWTLYSDNQDIGKSSSDYPTDRITTYPKNTHWLGKVEFALLQMQGNAWWHRSTLDTHILRPQERINESDSQALDYGFDIGSSAPLHGWHVNWQMQMMGRTGVIIDEREFTLVPELAWAVRTLDASEHNVAGLVDASRTFGATSVALGGRLDWQRQENQTDAVTNTNMSAFVGTSHQLSQHWAASIYLSSAFRNPSLTERYFSGETPRGTVLGDMRLDTEQALNLQAGLAYERDDISASIAVFQQHINHYIERASVTEDIEVYRNLDRATIGGVSYQLHWQQSAAVEEQHAQGRWYAQLSGAWINGEDNTGATIADIPADNHRLLVGYHMHEIRVFSTVAYRASKQDIGEGEKALDTVVTLDIGARWEMTPRTALQASWRNLTNQQYYVSADEKAAFAQGKSLQLALTFLL
ncbi:TonB-dependent receptor [Alteromonas sp. C1M14]|uniref:TonB-dependent receptor plug domain-containing protein n=1 Tax=Alteromonas sp. C1M14 TaxID=2841567 RepID=UPI001C08840C|nr:TonB-dependent receptor [Alteromonas sp. C1M14]MBU2979331.1 TonB-dependent receptor [Alteromonas sp. C1M14]